MCQAARARHTPRRPTGLAGWRMCRCSPARHFAVGRAHQGGWGVKAGPGQRARPPPAHHHSGPAGSPWSSAGADCRATSRSVALQHGLTGIEGAVQPADRDPAVETLCALCITLDGPALVGQLKHPTAALMRRLGWIRAGEQLGMTGAHRCRRSRAAAGCVSARLRSPAGAIRS